MRRTTFLLALLPLILPLAVLAQRDPHVSYAYPAGGRQGTTFDLDVGGQYIDGCTGVFVSGGGVKVEVLRHLKILTAQQMNGMKNNMQKLDELEAIAKTNATLRPQIEKLRADIVASFKAIGIDTGIDRRAFEAYRKKAADPKKQLNPALSEKLLLRMTIAADAAPGDRDLRVIAKSGLSNPIRFQIGRHDEVLETEPNNSTVALSGNVPTPVVLNGQILPGDVDRFRFSARKGEKLIAAASARDLIPYLADAVPGWFQATLGLYDTNGVEVAFDDDFQTGPDPVIQCVIPRDDDYVLEIRDAIYRGREDFVYRITLGEIPFVSAVYPLGGKAGASTGVELDGWNLPAARATVEVPASPDGIVSVTLPLGGKGDLVRFPFDAGVLPETADDEKNDDADAAQKVSLPVIVNGRIDRAGDQDVFRFKGRAGDVIVAEVFARRLNSPLDGKLALTDAKGTAIATADDNDDKGAGLETHHADPRLEAKLPADGTYYLHVVDTQRKGGAAYAYRCRIGPPQPDFALRTVPASLNLRPGMTTPITVYAMRRDGFAGDIEVVLKDAPEGFAVGGGIIPAGQEKVRMTIAAPLAPTGTPVALVLEGRAKVGDREIRRQVVPAEDMMQAFFYRHLVPAQEFTAFLSGKGRTYAGPRIVSEVPVKIPAGGTAVMRVQGASKMASDRFEVRLNEPPEGLSVRKVDWVKDGAEIVLAADAAKLKPGVRGNLIVEGHVEKAAATGKTKDAKFKYTVGLLPAIPFEIVAPVVP